MIKPTHPQPFNAPQQSRHLRPMAALAVVAVCGQFDVVTLECERSLERIADGWLVVDNEDSHAHESSE